MMVRLIDAGAACKPEGSYADQAEFGKGNVGLHHGLDLWHLLLWPGRREGGGNVMSEWGQTIIPQSDPDESRDGALWRQLCRVQDD